jgi:hypothetical protein
VVATDRGYYVRRSHNRCKPGSEDYIRIGAKTYDAWEQTCKLLSVGPERKLWAYILADNSLTFDCWFEDERMPFTYWVVLNPVNGRLDLYIDAETRERR